MTASGVSAPSPATSTRPEQLSRAAALLAGPDARGLLGAAADAAGARLSGWSLRHVHRRGDRSVSALYDVVLVSGGVRHEVLLAAHVDTRGVPRGPLVLGDGEMRIAVWRFPEDPFLPGLPAAVSRRRVRELLDRVGAPDGEVDLRTRTYRPSRRAVVEVSITGPEARGRVLYLKVLTGFRASEVARIHRHLEGHLPVPPVVGVAGPQGILAMEALAGVTLRATLIEGGTPPCPGDLVELSRRLARSGLRSSRDPATFADPTRHVRDLCRLVPDEGDRLRRIAAYAAGVAGPRGVVHGDLHDGQLLCEGGRIVGLLDVDGAGTGVVAQDAGSLIAHLQAIGEVWPAAAARARRYADEVAAAYRPIVGPENLARGIAGAWLGLATGPHRAQESDWLAATRRRVERAAAWAGIA